MSANTSLAGLVGSPLPIILIHRQYTAKCLHRRPRKRPPIHRPPICHHRPRKSDRLPTKSHRRPAKSHHRAPKSHHPRLRIPTRSHRTGHRRHQRPPLIPRCPVHFPPLYWSLPCHLTYSPLLKALQLLYHLRARRSGSPRMREIPWRKLPHLRLPSPRQT